MRAHRMQLLAGLLPLLSACASDATGPASDAAASTTALGYRIVDLGTLGGTYSEAFGINASGQVVGQSSTAVGALHAFVWKDGVMTDLGTLNQGRQYTKAWAINRAGKAVGESEIGTEDVHAFAWKNGVLTDLGAYPGSTLSYAIDVNRTGQVLSPHAFLWTGGVWRQLPTLAFSNAINDSGWVAGGDWVSIPSGGSYSRSILLKKGKATYVAKLAGTNNQSAPLDVNNLGQMAGQCQNARAKWRAVLWSKFGKITNLGTLGGNESFAAALNDAGVVVGRSRTATNEVRGFVWKNGSMTDLGTLGGKGSKAEDVNDAGWIAGSSTRADNATHATLWMPQ
jgi:probable HAF family extracellular repeat protein